MWNWTLLFSMVGLTVAPSERTAPTYLLCSFPNGPAALDVTADEANGEVTTLVQANGYMERRPAVFTPAEVKWSSPSRYGFSYTLSRVDLSLKRSTVIGEKEFVHTGTCKLQQAPKRAF